MDCKKNIKFKNIFAWLLISILCLSIPMSIAPLGAKAETVTTENLAIQEFSEEQWEIVNKDQTDVSEIKEVSPELNGLEFTSDGRFGGQIISKEKYTGAITLEMDFSGTMDPNVAYTYMYIGRKSTDAVSQENWSDDGIILGFNLKGVAIYDETCSEQEMGEHWRCRFDSGVGFWRPIYTAGGYREGNFSYKIVINASSVEVYSEYNTQYNDPNPLGKVALANSDFSLTNGYIAISNRYSKYTLNSFKVNGNYTSVNDWYKHDGVTFIEGSNIPSQVVLKDVDNVKSSASPLTENPMLVSKFNVSTANVEENAEVFSLNLDIETIRPRNDYFRFLFGLSKNNDNPSKVINFTSLGIDGGTNNATCCYIFDSSFASKYVDGLAVNHITIAIKGYQNGDVVFTYKCPDPACPEHTATVSNVNLNGKIGVQTLTDSDAPQSQCIKLTRQDASVNLFKGNVVKPVTVTLTDGVTTTTEQIDNGTYTLPNIFTEGKTLIGWLDEENNLQKPGKVYTELTADTTFRAVEVNLGFALVDGASIRIDQVGDTSGIRFTAVYNTSAMQEIESYVSEIGMLLVKTSAFEAGTSDAQKAAAFIYKDDLAHEFKYAGVEDGELTKRTCAIYQIPQSDFGTAISARAYIKINYADGEGYIYTDFTEANNSRSIKEAAKNLQGTDFYNGLDADQKLIIDSYAGE